MIASTVILGVSILVFLALHMAPGDPVDMLIPPDVAGRASPEYIEQVRSQWGLDKPLHLQFFDFVNRVVRLDMGRSMRTNRRIGEDLLLRYPATLELGLASLLIANVIGISVGVAAATKRNSTLDNMVRPMSFMGISMPSFWQGLLLMLLFAYYLDWLPASGRGGPVYTLEGLRHIILPAITMGTASSALLVRLVRSSMLTVLNEDYVRTARAKGLSERVVVYRHALRNAMVPVITIVGIQVGAILGGAVVIESVFAWPGVGRFMITGINGRDFPVVQASVLVVATTFVLVNVIVDIVYAVVDPRIRYS